jgi:hypothetical protein
MNAIARPRYRFVGILGAVLVLGVAGSGLVNAAGSAQTADPTIRTCYQSPAQPLRQLLITTTGVCPSGFTTLDISVQGPQGIQGPAGPAGPAGPTGPPCLPTNPACVGPQGPPGSGLAGFEVVPSGDIVFEAFEVKDFFVDCPSGKKAISAGFGILGGQSAVELIGSVPSGQSWGFRGDNPAAVSQFARATVVCANAS